MKASLKNYRQSPRKVRLVADLIKGKSVEQALIELDSLAKRAATPIKKLLASAVANAKELGKSPEKLFVKDLRIDKGVVLKRIRPAAMGAAHRINKRTSNVFLSLAEISPKSEKEEQETNLVKEEKN